MDLSLRFQGIKKTAPFPGLFFTGFHGTLWMDFLTAAKRRYKSRAAARILIAARRDPACPAGSFWRQQALIGMCYLMCAVGLEWRSIRPALCWPFLRDLIWCGALKGDHRSQRALSGGRTNPPPCALCALAAVCTPPASRGVQPTTTT